MCSAHIKISVPKMKESPAASQQQLLGASHLTLYKALWPYITACCRHNVRATGPN